MNQKEIAPIIMILIIVGVLAVGGGTYYFLQKKNETGCIQVIVPARNQKTGECKIFPTPCDMPSSGWTRDDSCQTEEQVSSDEAADWKTYRNEKYGFEMDYPSIEGWRFRENWPLKTYSKGGQDVFSYYREDLVDPDVTDLVIGMEGAVGEIYFVESGCAIFQEKEVLGGLSCGLPVGMPFAERTSSESGVKGYRGNDGMVASAYEAAGPVRFVIFPLKIDFENRHSILLIYYIPSLHPEAMEKFFEQVISTFRFIK